MKTNNMNLLLFKTIILLRFVSTGFVWKPFNGHILLSNQRSKLLYYDKGGVNHIPEEIDDEIGATFLSTQQRIDDNIKDVIKDDYKNYEKALSEALRKKESTSEVLEGEIHQKIDRLDLIGVREINLNIYLHGPIYMSILYIYFAF